MVSHLAVGKNANPATLPLDPDELEETPQVSAGRPVHLRPRLLALVFVGGVGGTAAREAITLAYPAGAGVPYAVLAINMLGALLLGALLEALLRHGPDEGAVRGTRLLLGTGLLGGFTTYGTFALGIVQLLQGGKAAAGIGYAVVTLVGGAAATGLGIWLGAALGARTGPRGGGD